MELLLLLLDLVNLTSVCSPDCGSLLFKDSSFAEHVVDLGIFDKLLHTITHVGRFQDLGGRGAFSRILGHKL